MMREPRGYCTFYEYGTVPKSLLNPDVASGVAWPCLRPSLRPSPCGSRSFSDTILGAFPGTMEAAAAGAACLLFPNMSMTHHLLLKMISLQATSARTSARGPARSYGVNTVGACQGRCPLFGSPFPPIPPTPTNPTDGPRFQSPQMAVKFSKRSLHPWHPEPPVRVVRSCGTLAKR